MIVLILNKDGNHILYKDTSNKAIISMIKLVLLIYLQIVKMKSSMKVVQNCNH